MLRLCLLATLSACWVQPVQQRPVYNQPPPQQTQLPPPAGATVNKSEWQGTYVCAQGATSLHLAIEQRCVASGCEVGAVFEFGPSPQNPNVAHGSYRMRGAVNENERGEPVLTLQPDSWIEQPPNYMMVGLSATSDAGQQNMRGRIDNPSCGELVLQRVQ
jgi:hypothetical protein